MKTLLRFSRMSLGLLAAVCVLGGAIDVLYGLVSGAPVAILLEALALTFVALGVAYGALNHFPWERSSAASVT